MITSGLAACCFGVFSVGLATPGVVHHLEAGEAPAHWIVLGPFPNEPVPLNLQVGSAPRAGLDRDYLTSLGGEGSAVFSPDTRVTYLDSNGLAQEVGAAIVASADHGLVDLVTVLANLGPTSNRVAYAFCLMDSGEARTVYARFGSDDRAKVWVNGDQVHQFTTMDRPVNPDDDTFTFNLRKGLNRILVKVDNGLGGWGFALRIFSEEVWAERLAEEQQKARMNRAIGMNLEAGGPWNSFVIPPGALPEPRWANPELMASVFGEMTVSVRWFDRELNEVSEATNPGRHIAVYEARPEHGPVIRRMLTYYVAPEDFQPWRLGLQVPLPYLANSGINPEVWYEAGDTIAQAGGELILGMLFDRPTGALLLSALHDRQVDPDLVQAVSAGYDPIRFRHQDVNLALKRKLSGQSATNRLNDPRPSTDRSGAVLRDGDLEQAGFSPGLQEALEPLAQAWAERSGIPFTLLVARGGIIAHDGAYGRWQGEPTQRSSAFDIASISKLITGTLLVRFVDQGLIDLDLPIGHYLPDFPTNGDKVITVRQCMMHLVGTEGHGTFGGFDNPWFENQVLHQVPILEPGIRYLYNGLSMNLAGRCLEAVEGRTFVRLMHEALFDPLGLENTTVFDAAYGIRTTARDLATIGQLLLNHGIYGNHEFFSEKAFQELLPVRVGDVQPGSSTPDVVYGLGTSWEHGPLRPNASDDTPEKARSLLGWNTLSHGSATRSVLRVDYDHDLVIAMARPAIGDNYDAYWEPILRTIADHLLFRPASTPLPHR